MKNICDECKKLCTSKFCSRSCAAIFNNRKRNESGWKHSDETIRRLKSIIPHNKGKTPTEIIKKCHCGVEFKIRRYSKKQYCSLKCNPNTGGYRPRSGRAKTGYYKGVYCGSTYELVWIIYQLDHCINFERFPGFLEKDGIKYYPDFLQNGNIVEIKGYESKESVSKKTAVAESFGYSVLELRKDDLIHCFKWVKENYNYKNLVELYDNHKPKFQYTCNHCGNLINREKKSKSEINFCSRICSGKGHKGRVPLENRKNQYTKLREAAGVAPSPSN